MARDTVGDALAGGELKWLGAAKENTREISERLKKVQKMTVGCDPLCTNRLDSSGAGLRATRRQCNGQLRTIEGQEQEESARADRFA